jgi:hypothetical protein
MSGSRKRLSLLLAACVVASVGAPLEARTVYRCARDGKVSLSTAPESGSRCESIALDDRSALPPNLGVTQGALYRRVENGRVVLGTRELPGATHEQSFTLPVPAHSPAHAGLGEVGTPRIDRYAAEFRASAKATGVDDALLRAIAHAESGFDRLALSPKGAQGVMQLMPATAEQYGVADPFASDQSIRAGAKLLRDLISNYRGDMTLVAAAYNAGMGTVDRYGGVPPYAETRDYVTKVLALHSRYRLALAASGP